MASDERRASGRPAGQLERALTAMTIGVQQGAERRARALAEGRMGEYEQQIHVTLNGNATTGYGYVDQPVSFEYPFVWSPAQRRSPFGTPHFTYGIEMTTATAVVIHIGAQVTSWSYDASNRIVGATVRFFVSAPESPVIVPYNAIAHLSFQGYAAYSETSEFFGGGDPITPSGGGGGGAGAAPINITLPVVS